jgi:hypothetical protein
VSERRRGAHHIPREAREAAVAALRALLAAGQLTNARVTTVADGLGVSTRTVSRWLESEATAGGRRRECFELSEDDLAELACWHWQRCGPSPVRGGVPSRWTLQRAVARALSPGWLKLATLVRHAEDDRRPVSIQAHENLYAGPWNRPLDRRA